VQHTKPETPPKEPQISPGEHSNAPSNPASTGPHDSELTRRLGKYGLELHPDKTRLVDFRRPDRLPPGGGNGGSRTFDLLGFTHFWGKARSGKWVVKRRTAKERFRRAIMRVALWCRKHRHDDGRAQQKALGQKLRGHFDYYGIIGTRPRRVDERGQPRRSSAQERRAGRRR
jgi:hypothetical protein